MLPAICALALMASCRVSGDDIETWKGTVKGPGKMVAVLMADKYELPLRVSAGRALVEMERSDVDGVAELQRALQRLEAKPRADIVDGMAPGLIELMQAGDKGASSDPNQGPPPQQIRAKDAAFALIAHAGPESRKALTEGVVGWYTADFNGRSLSGAYSAEQVVRALGSPAAALLVDALDAKMPQQALVKLAQLVGQLGEAGAKAAAGKKLVAIEQTQRGPEFVKWLQAEINEQLSEGGKKPDPARVAKAAVLNRDKFIDEGTLPAMKHLASQAEVADRLLAIASDPSPALAGRRTRALQAMEGAARQEHLPQLLALALDTKAPPSVRDYAFDRVGDIGSPKAVDPMWPVVADAGEQRLRWRAGELVLALGGASVVEKFFETLPSGGKYEPEELEGYATRMGQMAPLPTAIVTAQLGSDDWWDRVIALHYLARKGSAADVPRMSRLQEDSKKPEGKGWQPAETVGTVAKGAIAGLRERLGHGKAEKK
ncbi:MAG: hypothetical protein OEZ06_30100 [Myxococcales bacterium]|nr:hypothetical protein [Myxococcales bacterium]